MEPYTPAVIRCPACGAENSRGKKFCTECGTPLARVCPSCAAPVEGTERFCGECGTPLGADPSPGVARDSAQLLVPVLAATPVAERRLVSVLFADLVGFTTLSESRDAEEVRELLTRYFDASRRLIERYGGTVEKFIGDAVMAVWGAPVAQEDDAERAVRAALDLVAAVAAMGEEVGAPNLRARAGVLTGEAAVTIGAQAEGMVAGDMVNTASRIQSAAQPGTVLAGDATRRATEAAIAYEDAGAHEMKGKAEPIPLWRAVRIVAGARGGLKSEGLEAPFVGRDREFRTMKDLFFSSTEDGKAHLVSVIGIAGIGKSRLSWEFYKYFDGLPQTTYYHRGRCLSYGEGVAYWPLVEMVKMRARIAEAEDASSALSKLHATVEENLPDPEERKWVEPRLAHLLGLEERTATDREDLFAAWRLFFERLSERDPVLMVFEDVHWADASLVDFIEYLLEWSRNYPILVLTLGRPEFLERHPTWGSGKRNFTSLYLEPLSSESMRELMRGLVPGLTDDVTDQILARAEGIPLYAVETVRMLLDKGLLVQEGSVYKPTGPIHALAVPETLQALIAARLDGLAPDERKLIQAASVLGKTFFKQGLVAVSGVAESELDPLLASLVRKEVLSIQADARSPDRGQYGFLQDLVKKVAYDTLSKRERKTKHLAAAAFIERGWGGEEEEIVEIIASHFLNAYEAAPDASDAADIKARARDMLARAGDRAASLAASGEAERYFEQAATLADEPLARATLLERVGRMAWMGGRGEEARRAFEEAITLFENERQSHPAARVSALLGDVDQAGGQLDQAIERMETAFAVLSEEEPDEDIALLAAQLARLHFFRGEFEQAHQRVERALDLAEWLWLPEVLAEALQTKGVLAINRGRLEEAHALIGHSLEIALGNDLTSSALRAYNNLGETLTRRDRFDDAVEAYDSGVALATRAGNQAWAWILLSERSYTLAMVGRWHDALASVADIPQDAYAELRPIGLATSLTEIHGYRGEPDEIRSVVAAFGRLESTTDLQERFQYAATRAMLARSKGRWAEALTAAEEAIAGVGEVGVGSQAVRQAYSIAGEAALALGDLGKVQELLALVERVRPGEVPPSLRAQAERLRGLLAAARGEAGEVEAPFKRAAGSFRELGMPFWLAVTLLQHGEWLVAQGRAEEAEPHLAEAGETFERLEARPWLERLSSISGRPAPLTATRARTPT